jgi:xylulokinase
MGLNVQVMRVGNDNLFQSAIFSGTISNLVGSRIELVETTGAVGAAKAAGVATGFYATIGEAMQEGRVVKVYEPAKRVEDYQNAYRAWEENLEKALGYVS